MLTSVAAFLAGLLCILGASFEWDWFMNHHKVVFLERLLGRTGVRLFYIILGLALLGLSSATC